ncbi:succinylglutamate desuccinylase/aspartoacylase family protein [Acidovorax sp. 62]|uniref:M14 family metallopeptidase n=1 Tax=Acidovorax sp. 62 TaxID=2035203 RepID=UPI000C1952A2|nr:M14 family metallocarboxypeptidase [Acidovorax sp. 62]PIF90231.1 succinylglutamate desuccinylase/aspartoacylase family protein [Acidovorax sp. 62]
MTVPSTAPTTAPASAFPPASYPIGTPGQPWGAAELAQWRARQVRQRSYADDVLAAVDALRTRFDVTSYGEVAYGDERYALQAIRPRAWVAGLPTVLVTGGVHGYETSGVMGALRFVDQHGERYAGRVNWLVAPCISPWGWERIQRWNHDVIDPNRSFRPGSTVQESAALMALVAQVASLCGPFAAHMDLHETTDTDESEYRPAVAARDGKAFEPGSIPDGFYLVDDTENPQPAFQQAVLQAVARVTHIAPPDERNEIIGSPMTEPGVIRYELAAWGLCASVTGARYTTTTEVYPDSPRTTPEACTAAQVAAVCAALDFVLASGR